MILHLEVARPTAFRRAHADRACRRAVEAGARPVAARPDLRGLEALGFRERGRRLPARFDGIRALAGL